MALEFKRFRAADVLLVGVALMFVGVTTACYDDSPLAGRDAEVAWRSVGPSDLEKVTALATESLDGHPAFLSISADLPSFSGFYYDEQGQLVVALTNLEDVSRALPLIQPHLSSDRREDRVTPRLVEYSFLELARYRTALRGYIFTIPGVVTLGVKESQNRVQIGIAAAEAETTVRSLLSTLGIPPEAVIFRTTPYPRELTHTLDDGQGNIQGGWQIMNADSQACSLGFAALRADGSEVFVTNSHCTTSEHAYDGGPIYQPWALDYLLGWEILDPEPHTCGYPGFEDLCRNADAALIDAVIPIDLGTIARTSNRAGGEGVPGVLTIDHQSPTLTITSRILHVYENEELDKIGQRTGWTYGAVEDTCDDVEMVGWVRQCSDRVDFHADRGDSGAPVFDLKTDGTIEMRGIVFGGAGLPWHNDTWISDLGQIQNDLGTLTLFEPVVNAAIIGPSVVPAHAPCGWQATAGGGSPPYQYEWHRDGVLVSTSDAYFLFDTGTSDFQLELQVTDDDGGTDQDDLWINVDSSSQTFC